MAIHNGIQPAASFSRPERGCPPPRVPKYYWSPLASQNQKVVDKPAAIHLFATSPQTRNPVLSLPELRHLCSSTLTPKPLLNTQTAGVVPPGRRKSPISMLGCCPAPLPFLLTEAGGHVVRRRQRSPPPRTRQTLARQRPGAHAQTCLLHGAIWAVGTIHSEALPFDPQSHRIPPSTAKHLKAGRHTRALSHRALPTASIRRPRPPRVTTVAGRSPVPEHSPVSTPTQPAVMTTPQPPGSPTSYPSPSSHRRPD